MDSIPFQLQADGALLRNRSVPTCLHPLYKKWLRFYLDFCQKYRFSETERKSLGHFLRKLQEKKQTDMQQQQASHAIMLYYELIKYRDTSGDKPLLFPEVMIPRMGAATGHSDVRTTMIYTHTVKSVTIKEARSPLDF